MNTKTTAQSMSPRRQRNRERVIQEILGNARLIMREEGVAALSMHELARRMEIKPPSLYNYFSGLMDIYDALFRLGFSLWEQHIEAYTQGAGTWQEEFQLAMEAYLTFALQNPALYQLCFERPVPGFEPSQESLRVSVSGLGQWVARIASLKNEINTDLPPEQIVDLVIAIMHGLTALHMANEPHLPLGQGRFGALIPAAMSVLDKAWS